MIAQDDTAVDTRQHADGSMHKCRIKKIVPCIGTVKVIGSVNGEETERILLPRECLVRAKALSDMRDRLRLADERAAVQTIIEEFVEACRVCKEKASAAYVSSRVSMSGAMYKGRRTARR